MHKFLSIRSVQSLLRGLSGALEPCVRLCADFRRDPLAHPALEAMSARNLGDLPAGELRARVRV